MIDCSRTWKFALMHRNGFIFIVLTLTAVSQAGPQLYLPAVGPVALRFDSDASARPSVTLPVASEASATTGNGSRLDMIPEIIVDSPPNDLTASNSLMHDPPVVEVQNPGLPAEPAEPLIGPMVETNNVITPQMLMRYFTPSLNGAARETIVIPPTGFIPGRPPTTSSTVKYSQPKP